MEVSKSTCNKERQTACSGSQEDRSRWRVSVLFYRKQSFQVLCQPLFQPLFLRKYSQFWGNLFSCLVFNQPGFQYFLNLYLSQTLFQRGKHFNIPCFVLFHYNTQTDQGHSQIRTVSKLTIHLFLLSRAYLELPWNGP